MRGGGKGGGWGGGGGGGGSVYWAYDRCLRLKHFDLDKDKGWEEQGGAGDEQGRNKG